VVYKAGDHVYTSTYVSLARYVDDIHGNNKLMQDAVA